MTAGRLDRAFASLSSEKNRVREEEGNERVSIEESTSRDQQTTENEKTTTKKTKGMVTKRVRQLALSSDGRAGKAAAATAAAINGAGGTTCCNTDLNSHFDAPHLPLFPPSLYCSLSLSSIAFEHDPCASWPEGLVPSPFFWDGADSCERSTDSRRNQMLSSFFHTHSSITFIHLEI